MSEVDSMNRLRVEAERKVADLERELAAKDELLATMRPFFNTHALGPLARPSCLCCGRNDYESVAVQHAELPGVVICDKCKQATTQLAAKAEECERLKELGGAAVEQLTDLIAQIENFAAEQGEADFFTGNAGKAREAWRDHVCNQAAIREAK